MAIEALTVTLNNGDVLYFDAGAVVDDPVARVDLLRDAIDSGSLFRSVDTHGTQREFNGTDVASYFLS
ncbi:hypothetical protein ACEE90_00655 [Corynebacterium phoceense]|uniref:hypothetical protein n=1 Tax=Corynebacterium phoceense TaxID=1686286 RepID=UPI001DC1CD22|nr:hypothetical protein [Corynebacterium phoceense]MCQ9334384.1 hypothetical protein [Corynebacterium phoceense]MCQ9337437.1 hypothetical protein [Corynebacterium phoceense]HJG42700.1 hypothetical protein [Corynebacterium phoceense]